MCVCVRKVEALRNYTCHELVACMIDIDIKNKRQTICHTLITPVRLFTCANLFCTAMSFSLSRVSSKRISLVTFHVGRVSTNEINYELLGFLSKWFSRQPQYLMPKMTYVIYAKESITDW